MAQPDAEGRQLVGTYSLDADAVQPWAGIFNWDRGFPQNRFVPAEYDVSWGNRNRPAMFDSDYGRTGYTQQWNLNIQRELPGRFVLDAGYVGNKSTGLLVGGLNNFNRLPASALGQYGRNLNNAVRTEAEAAAASIAYPYAGFRGTVASALRPYPQVQGNQTVQVYGSPLGFTSYHCMQAVLNREWDNGLTLYTGYVRSKSIQNHRSLLINDDPNRPIDYYNLKLEKALGEQDRTHYYKALIQYELPVGKGRSLWSGANALQTAIFGGWQVSTILNYATGLPLNFQSSFPLSGGWNGLTNRPNVAPGNLRQSGYDDSFFDFANPGAAANTYIGNPDSAGHRTKPSPATAPVPLYSHATDSAPPPPRFESLMQLEDNIPFEGSVELRISSITPPISTTRKGRALPVCRIGTGSNGLAIIPEVAPAGSESLPKTMSRSPSPSMSWAAPPASMVRNSFSTT